MTAPDKDGWIEWKGGECPVADDVRVTIRWWDADLGDEQTAEERADAFWWPLDGKPGEPVDGDIIAYRVVQS